MWPNTETRWWLNRFSSKLGWSTASPLRSMNWPLSVNCIRKSSVVNVILPDIIRSFSFMLILPAILYPYRVALDKSEGRVPRPFAKQRVGQRNYSHRIQVKVRVSLPFPKPAKGWGSRQPQSLRLGRPVRKDGGQGWGTRRRSSTTSRIEKPVQTCHQHWCLWSLSLPS